MIKVVDLVYYCHNEYNKPQQVLDKHRPSLGFADFIKDRIDIEFVKHLNYEGFEKIDGVKYAFFKSSNSYWHIPFKTHQHIKKLAPGIVIVEGFIFPLQLMILKLKLGRKCKIIVQHHGERPAAGLKKFFQQLADKFVSAYLFTSYDNAAEWIDAKIISGTSKCRELLEASTWIKRKNKQESRLKVGMSGEHNFLWVGRLDTNKDPVTVLKGFEKYAAKNPGAKLYMIYQEDSLLDTISALITKSDPLLQAVKLIGKIPHEELADWYSAADFYISGSHKEGSGYALLEAMACGCIPIVTAIPSFKRITQNGKVGFLYTAGDEASLEKILETTRNVDVAGYSGKVESYFKENLSFKNIADDLYKICNDLVNVKE